MRLYTEEQRLPVGWRAGQALASQGGHSWKSSSLEQMYKGVNRWVAPSGHCEEPGVMGARGRKGGTLEMGLEKLAGAAHEGPNTS